jgi:hypothetical protein
LGHFSFSDGPDHILSYPDFQISGGVGGNAKAEADAVFVTPFAGVDLSTVSKQNRDAVEAMRQSAEAAEIEEFDPQIAAAHGATGQSYAVPWGALVLTVM